MVLNTLVLLQAVWKKHLIRCMYIYVTRYLSYHELLLAYTVYICAVINKISFKS